MSFSQRLQAAYLSAEQRPEASDFKPVAIDGTRNAFLRWAYESGMVVAGAYSGHLSDKLFFARLLKSYAPAAYARFHPATLSPEEFTGEDPRDFIAKPVAGMSGEGGLIYQGRDAILAAMKGVPLFLETGLVSPISGLLSSGRHYLIQERLVGLGPELRVHTLGGRVVAGATFTRWDTEWDLAAFGAAEAALQEFLDLLPEPLVRGQAWAVDLLCTKDGHKIIEVNTNRGFAGQWSGDLSLPDVLGAYVREIEGRHGQVFLGEGGEAFRSGTANLAKYIEKFGAESWERHCRLRAHSLNT
ncbi:MAG: hypothetical protein EOP11_05770 [Proteobacteria bacterium]|nr:MAG: hypothetical protein EOP11_05770 [Pseudomonadota bacterium]